MFTLIFKKLILRYIKSASIIGHSLLFISIFKVLLESETDENDNKSLGTASELAKSLSDESKLLSLIDEDEEGLGKRTKTLLKDEAVVYALTHIFTVRKIVYKDECEKVSVLDKAILALKKTPIDESLGYIRRINREASKRLKVVRKDVKRLLMKEANKAIYEALFPKLISPSDMSKLLALVGSAYVLGSYLFTIVVFKCHQSVVVGLELSDYLLFATQECWLILPILPFAFMIAHSNTFEEARGHYLSAEYDVTRKRYTYIDIIMYLSLVLINIPIFQKLIGMEAERWAEIALFDVLLVILVAMKHVPYEDIFDHWYLTQLAVLFSLILIVMMSLNGMRFAEDLIEASSTDWHYQFNDEEVSSSHYSFVYFGTSSAVFYNRDNGKFLVKPKGALMSFVGNL